MSKLDYPQPNDNYGVIWCTLKLKLAKWAINKNNIKYLYKCGLSPFCLLHLNLFIFLPTFAQCEHTDAVVFCPHYLCSCSSRTWMSIYTCLHTHSHTWVARGPVDLIPSLAACARFHPPLPSLPAAVAAQLPAAAGKGTKAAFVVRLQLHYHESCPATVNGTLGLTRPPVQMLMNWDIVLISFSQFCILCCMCSLLKTMTFFVRLSDFLCFLKQWSRIVKDAI